MEQGFTTDTAIYSLCIFQDNDVNARPIIRADCIKFVHTFRNQFTVEQLLAMIPVLIAHLGSEHVSLGRSFVFLDAGEAF